MLLITAAGALCIIFANFLSARIGMSYGRDLRDIVFTRIEQYSLNEFDKFGTASLITRTTNDITQLQMAVITNKKMSIILNITSLAIIRKNKLCNCSQTFHNS